MASRASANRTPEWRVMLKRSLLRLAALGAAVLLCAMALMLALALLTYSPADRSMNTDAGPVVANVLGTPGAWSSDILLWLLGVPVGLSLPLMLISARRMWFDQDMKGWQGQIGKCLAGIFLIGLSLSLFQPEPLVGLPAGWGGLLGLVAARGLLSLAAVMDEGVRRWVMGGATLVFLGAGILLWVRSLALEKPLIRFARPSVPSVSFAPVKQLFKGAAKADRGADRAADRTADYGDAPPERSERMAEPRRPVDTSPKPPINIQTGTPAAAKAFAPVSGQDDLFGNGSLPSPELLSAPPPSSQEVKIDKAALERNARLLESVLDDFHVKGHITEVRPGPVVTMYELEPAPGIKASRVIALADDIARNMSALSARVATIPGRTVIGIELPNANRESVVLRELITSQAFADQNAKLPIILGKNISGEPIVADLAPMPHLLIAGTTGSGKSVGLNCMILSLLYRMTPDELRLIMIDPKMLELSIYDDIPHLLAPVVTAPDKAIRALKWAVEQMEDRYRMMASIGVRNLENYNEKVRAAKAKGKPLGRRVQTGYDPETGQPIYEEEQLDYQPLPQIVVVVDELADLMMTAGKEVEFLIQRIAQKARAAGIHLILATQRPSVDVITGVIKANLPTRISFFVTSKIDSRTILGEQGAEQLLGKGDMLYMAGGKGLTRVHGPFVSDDEVRAVADHWRSKGTPDYISAVTEEPEDGGFALDGADLGDDSADAKLYRKACQLVFENQKASTSWLQRQLRVGYNSAARLIEKMEEEGLVGPPNHVGRRDVLRDENGHMI
ncbi:MAG TPA: DNA translocase FtsK 4TM domain-containing protein [Sphingobium sp.]